MHIKSAQMRDGKIKELYMRPNMLTVTTNNWNNAANAWGQSKSAFLGSIIHTS